MIDLGAHSIVASHLMLADGFQTPSSLSTAAFLAIVALVLLAFLLGVYAASPERNRARRALMTAAATALWLSLFAGIVNSGWVARSPMPRLMIFFLTANTMAAAMALSLVGRWLQQLDLRALVLFQAFRLPLELVLHQWAAQGTIPETMTWTGQNFDIVTGVVALIAGPFANRAKGIAWFANGVGIVLLLNVMRVAVLSSPLPFAWPLTRPLLLGFHMPYALIVPVCVAGAFAGHMVLTRALLKASRSSV